MSEVQEQVEGKHLKNNEKKAFSAPEATRSAHAIM